MYSKNMELKRLTQAQQEKEAKKFIDIWTGRGDELSDRTKFWIQLLRNIFGVINPEQAVDVEKRVRINGSLKRIDAYISETKVLIEMKSSGVDLDKTYLQSDGVYLTPYEQAFRYSQYLPHRENPRWIVTSNFEQIRIYDMDLDAPQEHPEIILLKNLSEEFYRLNFLISSDINYVHYEEAVSKRAGTLVGNIYKALLNQYDDQSDPVTLRSLNILCVRLVFLFYAEDAGLLGSHKMFVEFIKRHRDSVQLNLAALFEALDTKESERKNFPEDIDAFPYIDGGLFAEKNISVPRISDGITDMILEASEFFNWKSISPTIFGSVFESTLNPEKRRKGGMHYTSLENIHKVIDPLFLDDLKHELSNILKLKTVKIREKRLKEFQRKLSSLTFLDPAAGSGNFLTETYICLRKLENIVIIELYGKGLRSIDYEELTSPIMVTIDQFNGIEINDFAVSVARTALWIAEHQMHRETEKIVYALDEFLPLKNHSNIKLANALKLDWNEVIPKSELNYIIGNPPYAGSKKMDEGMKQDMLAVFDGWNKAGNLDYVSSWYKLSADMCDGSSVRAALLSTNSITQGEQVAILWAPLFEEGIHIDFAHRTFVWDSEATSKAAVHCVVVGFSKAENDKPKMIYDEDRKEVARNINAYLLNAPNVVIVNRRHPIDPEAPEARSGNKPIDNQYYLFTPEEKDEFVKIEPNAEKWFRPWIGADEYVNGYLRYCLYLKNCPPEELAKMPHCLKLIEKVRKFRSSSSDAGTRRLSRTPTKFHVETIVDHDYLTIPLTTGNGRFYVPLGFVPGEYLSSNLMVVVPDATIYDFGIITSNVFMTWMRAIGGKLKSDYRITKDNVYNNFPWPRPSLVQRKKILTTARNILITRDRYPNATFAALYGSGMPEDLQKAHEENDKAVLKAYGFPLGITEDQLVRKLIELYKIRTGQS